MSRWPQRTFKELSSSWGSSHDDDIDRAITSTGPPLLIYRHDYSPSRRYWLYQVFRFITITLLAARPAIDRYYIYRRHFKQGSMAFTTIQRRASFLVRSSAASHFERRGFRPGRFPKILGRMPRWASHRLRTTRMPLLPRSRSAD